MELVTEISKPFQSEKFAELICTHRTQPGAELRSFDHDKLDDYYNYYFDHTNRPHPRGHMVRLRSGLRVYCSIN